MRYWGQRGPAAFTWFAGKRVQVGFISRANATAFAFFGVKKGSTLARRSRRREIKEGSLID